MINEKQIEALSHPLKQLLQLELDAGNTIEETFKGWPEHPSVGVILTRPFMTLTAENAPAGIFFNKIHDRTAWDAEFVDAKTHDILACFPKDGPRPWVEADAPELLPELS